MPTTVTTTPLATIYSNAPSPGAVASANAANVGAGQNIAPQNTPSTGKTIPLTPISAPVKTVSPAVVTAQPAVNSYNQIANSVSGIKEGISTQAANITAQNALPTIPGYNVSATPTGSQGEQQATNNVNGSKYFITPQNQPQQNPGLSASQVTSMLNEGESTTTPQPTDLTSENSNFQGNIQQALNDESQAYNNYKSQIQSLTQGVFPLSGAQQAFVDSTSQAFDSMIKEANLKGAALASETGGFGNKVGATLGEISNIDSAKAAALAKLELGFQDQNYKLINDSYTAYTKAESSKTDLLSKLHEDVISQAKDIRQANLQAQQAKLETAKFEETKIQNEISNRHKEEQLAQTKNEFKDLHDVFGNVIGTQVFDKATGKPVATYSTGGGFGTGSGVDGAFNIQTNSSGKQWLDTTGLTGKDLVLAQRYANAKGVATVTKDEAADLKQIETARLNQDAIVKQALSFLPKDAEGRLAVGPENKLSQYLQTDDKIAAFNSWRTAAINTLRATAGSKGLRINQAEIDSAMKNDIPNITDTVGVALQKYANINKLLDNQEDPVLRLSANAAGKTYTFQDPKTGAEFTGSTTEDLKEAKAKGYILKSQ